MTSRSRNVTLLAGLAIAGLLVSAPGMAHAQNGSWRWGPPGFSHGQSPQWRMEQLLNHGLADPMVDYYTPVWGSERGSTEINHVDTGFRNTFSINHDINAAAGIPILGYLDILTPLLGTNHLAIAATVSSVWNGITDAVSSAWNWLTDRFSSSYNDYVSSGSYSGGGYDNAFVPEFTDYGGGCFLRAGESTESGLIFEGCD